MQARELDERFDNDENVLDLFDLSTLKRPARDLVVRETPLDYPDLPSDCPYSLSQILDPNFPEDLSLH